MGKSNLFQRIGGLEGTTRIALSLYDRVMESERLEPFFAGVDMQRLVDHQARFLGSIMGGPDSFTDQELKAVHGPLAIDRESFREMIAQFRLALEDHDVPSADIEIVLADLTKREPCIVTRGKKRSSHVA
jgi:hemoglobin